MKAKTEIPETKEILSELKILGKNLTDNINAALKSEQRQKVEVEVKKGLNAFTTGVNQVIKDFKKGDMDEKIRQGLHKGLKEANKSLSEAVKTWKPVKKKKSQA